MIRREGCAVSVKLPDASTQRPRRIVNFGGRGTRPLEKARDVYHVSLTLQLLSMVELH